jgi:hypothetical protein
MHQARYAIVLSLIPHDLMYGPQAALIAECFTGRLRVQRRLARLSARFGHRRGPAPLVATALFAAFRSGYAIAIYIPLCAVISFAAARAVAGLHQPRHLGGIRPSLADFDHAGSAKDGFTFAIFC